MNLFTKELVFESRAQNFGFLDFSQLLELCFADDERISSKKSRFVRVCREFWVTPKVSIKNCVVCLLSGLLYFILCFQCHRNVSSNFYQNGKTIF